MEDLIFGLVKGVECKFVKTDPEIIEKISEKKGIPIDEVKHLLRYNIFTIKQFSLISGLAISSILNKTRVSQINGNLDTELDFCYPFYAQDNEGPKFIVRNGKSEKYLQL